MIFILVYIYIGLLYTSPPPREWKEMVRATLCLVCCTARRKSLQKFPSFRPRPGPGLYRIGLCTVLYYIDDVSASKQSERELDYALLSKSVGSIGMPMDYSGAGVETDFELFVCDLFRL